jgi:hypothetical protein
MFKYGFDWDDVWGCFFLLAALIALVTITIFCFAPKNVDYYYVSNGESGTASCVYAHWTWHPDEKAFCSDDRERTLDFATKANQALRH